MKIPPLWICLLVIVILVSLIIYVATHRRGIKDNVSQFVNTEPKSMFVRIVSEFGSPQIVINQKGGFAIWFPSKIFENSPYESVILKDEGSSESKNSFLYTTIIVDISDIKLQNILAICNVDRSSVYYDRTSKEFTVRSNSMAMNKHVLIAILRYLTVPGMSIKSAQDLIETTWFENMLDNTPFASTTFSDQSDDDILNMLQINIPMGSDIQRVNKELMMSQ